MYIVRIGRASCHMEHMFRFTTILWVFSLFLLPALLIAQWRFFLLNFWQTLMNDFFSSIVYFEKNSNKLTIIRKQPMSKISDYNCFILMVSKQNERFELTAAAAISQSKYLSIFVNKNYKFDLTWEPNYTHCGARNTNVTHHLDYDFFSLSLFIADVLQFDSILCLFIQLSKKQVNR